MKKFNFFIPLLLILCPYVFLLLFNFYIDENVNLPSALYICSGIIILIINIINFIFSSTRSISDYYKLSICNIVIKIICIPFYLIIFAVVYILISFFGWMIGPLSIIITIIATIIDYFLLIISSSYGINSLIRAKNNKLISTKFFIIHTILHLLFVLDVISSIIVFFKLSKERKKLPKAEDIKEK